jgi:hypothetical protein
MAAGYLGMEVNPSQSLAGVALRSAQIRLGEVIDATSYSVDVSNRVTVRHSIVRLRLEKPPEGARKYLFVRPKLVNQALAEIGARQRADTEAFFKAHAPEYLSGSISGASYDHDFPPVAYKQRTEKVLDRVETDTCRRCSGKGQYSETRTEYPKTTCLFCGGAGGEVVKGFLNQPGTTAHGAPVEQFKICTGCGGVGTVSGPMRTWVETIACSRCGGRGQIETKHYRKEKICLADAVRSQFRREATFTWPAEIQRLIKHMLVGDEELFAFCVKSGETCKVEASEVLIDVKVNMTIEQRRVEVDEALSAVSILKLGNRVVLFADTPILDSHLTRLRTELSGLSWKQVQKRAEESEFLARMTAHALNKTKPNALVPELGFMASRGRIGALMRRLRGIERRRRMTGRLLLFGVIAAAGYALIFHFGMLSELVRRATGW